MNNKFKKTLALTLSFALIAGCNSNSQPTQNNPSKSGSTGKSTDTINLLSEVKTKYAGKEDAEYTEPKYNLEKDAVFTFDNLPEAYFDLDDNDCFSVYYDSGLTQKVDISIERDYENKSVTVSPSLTFSYYESGYADKNWGSYSKFWLVCNVDLKTGKMLDRPEITVFTTKEDLNTPTLKQSVGNTGLYTLSWNEVDDADYYEVYRFQDGTGGSGSSFIEVTTESTSCTYDDFQRAIDHDKNFKDKYKDTEIDVNMVVSMNEKLENEDSYFVVARTNDGKMSGMSNICNVSQIGNQIPYMVSDDFLTEYDGSTATVLPAYAKVQMVDGSNGDFLIQYHQAEIHKYRNGEIGINCKFKNLPIQLPILTLSGMDYDTFKDETELITKREDELTTKSVTGNEDVLIPYLPDSDSTFPLTQETETPYESDTPEETPDDPDTPEETPDDPDTPEETPDDPDTPEETPDDPDTPEETPDDPDTPEEPTGRNYPSIELSDELKDSVYANSAMAEWIALNMLSHQEEIYLGDFPEYADSQKILAALEEAYTQNPLIGIMDKAKYDYSAKTLQISYTLSEEDTQKMQEATLSKAKEVVSSIITDDMNAYEKEAAINQYLCENAAYNEKIFDYINEDGSIADDAVSEFANSFTPYGVLVENLGVCESYAESFLLLAKEAGLNAIIVTGSMDGVNHEWNKVELEDAWYTLDVTNNDSETIPNGYFNLSDELAAKVLKEDNDYLMDTSSDWLQAPDDHYEYYTKNQWIAEDEDTAVNILTSLLQDKNQAAIRLNGDLDNTMAEQIAQSTCNKGNIANAKYYCRAGVLSIIKADK